MMCAFVAESDQYYSPARIAGLDRLKDSRRCMRRTFTSTVARRQRADALIEGYPAILAGL